LGLRGSGAGGAHSQHGAATAQKPLQTAQVTVGRNGYEPAALSFEAGVPVAITFVRTTNETCGTEIVFPELGIRRELPLNEPVGIEIGTEKAGEIVFGCDMGMLTGSVLLKR
jgi:plastocyanin domain-containing protein